MTASLPPTGPTPIDWRHPVDQMRAIVENTTDVVFVKDHDSRYLWVNATAAANFGLARSELVGRTDADLFPADVAEGLRAKDLTLMATREVRTFEQTMRFHDASERHYLSTQYPYLDDAGEVVGVIGINRDITERKLMERRLLRLNTQNALRGDVSAALAVGGPLEAMLSSCLEAIVGHLGVSFARLWAYNAAEAMLEIRGSGGHVPYPTSSLRIPVGGMLVGHIAETHRPYLTNDAQHEPRLAPILDRLLNSGMVSFAGVPLLMDGQLLGVLGMFSQRPMPDDTLEQLGSVADLIAQGMERKRLEERLREQNEELLALDRMKNAFVSSVSHELRTPLTSIMGFSEFLEDGLEGDLSPGQAAFVAQIQHHTRRLQHLVDDLLDYARLEAGTFKLSREAIALSPLIQRAADGLRPQIDAKGLRLTLDVSEGPVRVLADAVRLEQVLVNLLDNAVKFTPEGGAIGVKLVNQFGRIRVIVSDSGPGLTEADRARVFERFFRADATLTSPTPGTGLGLSIAKALVEAHDGEIGVESPPGHGAHFWFTVPAVEL